MKRIFFLIIVAPAIFLIALLVLSFFDSAIKKLTSPIPSLPPIPTEKVFQPPQVNEVTLGGKTYQFYFHKIAANETLDLIPNFKEATFSAQLVKEHKCDFGINGGFYKKEGGPLGLFQIENQKLGDFVQSTTFNGLFLQKRNGAIEIKSIFPAPDITEEEVGFQSGPLIFLKNELQPNFLDRDFSRRHLIAKSTNDNFYIFSIFEKDNKFNGPRLEDLYPIFLSSEFKNIADFDLVLNLDGGSASAFYDQGVQVEEFKPIGSFLCGRQI